MHKIYTALDTAKGQFWQEPQGCRSKRSINSSKHFLAAKSIGAGNPQTHQMFVFLLCVGRNNENSPKNIPSSIFK